MGKIDGTNARDKEGSYSLDLDRGDSLVYSAQGWASQLEKNNNLGLLGQIRPQRFLDYFLKFRLMLF